MRRPTIIVVLVSLTVLVTGCATSSPTYMKAQVTPTPPWGGAGGRTTTVTDAQDLAVLVSALPPGVGMLRRSPLAVGGIQSHEIRLTRESGKVDVIKIYNGGSAWSEGRGDWPLDDQESEELRRWLAAAESPQPE